jgi:hypothetical protein
MACPQYVTNIAPTEKIGNSLIKINNNFVNLNQELCDLKAKIDSTVAVRTFFYYGPNSGTNTIPPNPTSGMQDDIASYPSNSTIEQFINGTSSSNLNVPSFSKENDQVYVVYQKTGVYLPRFNRLGQTTFSVQVISQRRPTYITKSFTTPDESAIYSPLFVIWKLVAKKNNTGSLFYRVESGFPKFSQAETFSTNDWSNPTVWSEY